jgi:peptidoglycan/xylan/chitin deacetylase (PgdA/CDA1 family)
VTGALQNLVRRADSTVARLYLSMFRERNALVCFLFHSLFRNHAEMDRDLIDPLDRITVNDLRALVAYYVEEGYRFVTPDEVMNGLSPDARYAMITFDDGYYNNHLALPVLEAFDVPALFFISSGHVLEQKCFWWDVLYRERRVQGATPDQIYREALSMKFLRTEQIETQLIERFGDRALLPRTDVDRPMTADELSEFARHPLVHLGNHTRNHAILTNYTPSEVRDQIGRCQADLKQITGRLPTSISYPNGAFDDGVLAACREQDISLGFTVRPEKVSLRSPRTPQQSLRLGRFVPHSHAPMPAQCRTYRSDLLLYGALRTGYLRLMRGRISN